MIVDWGRVSNYQQFTGYGPWITYTVALGAGTAPTITTTSLPDGTQGTAYSQVIAATGDATITFAVTVGSLPPGLSLAADGTLSGTPTLAGSYSFTITATNGVGSDDQALTLDILAVVSQPSGGYWPVYDAYAYRRRREVEEARQLAEEAEAAQQTELEAELARRLHAELARQAELDNLQRLRELVASNAELTYGSDRVQTALLKARSERTFSRLQAFQRELIRAQEAEEMALLILLAMAD